MLALRGGQYGIGAGKSPCAIFFQQIECASRGEALENPLVDRTWIDPGGKISKIAKLSIAARVHDGVRRPDGRPP